MCYFMQSKYNLDEIWFQPSNYKNVCLDCRGKCKRPDSFRLHSHLLVVQYNLDEIWFQPSNYKNVCIACRGKCKRADSFRLHRHFLVVGILFRVTVKNISCGDWRLHLVLRTQFLQRRGGPRCSIFLWSRCFFLPVFRPSVFAPCFSFHVCSPSRCWLYIICCTAAVRGIFSCFFAGDAHFFTPLHSSKLALVDLTDILPNRCLHLWCLPISIASCCGIQNLFHKCGNNARVAPRSDESL